ncbi:MAG: hypothetical protein K9G70_11710, partial [Prolixibacteraceae bacterium]|nr:hypothetical protein [Prolixibacteraceae bacterium]
MKKDNSNKPQSNNEANLSPSGENERGKNNNSTPIGGHRGTLDIESFLNQDEQKDQLRILTAGSVDDGKSTLIG